MKNQRKENALPIRQRIFILHDPKDQTPQMKREVRMEAIFVRILLPFPVV